MIQEPWGRYQDAVKLRAKTVYRLLGETIDEYSKDRAEMVAAGLAFYTLLSMAPLILIAVALAGAILGKGAAKQEALRLVGDSMGSNAVKTVDTWVRQASDSGGVASLVGFLLVLYTASRLAEQLRVGLNQRPPGAALVNACLMAVTSAWRGHHWRPNLRNAHIISRMAAAIRARCMAKPTILKNATPATQIASKTTASHERAFIQVLLCSGTPA